MDEKERLANPISTAELERRWRVVRAAMEERGLDVLVMQSNNEFLGGYVKWFTDTPARNAYFHSLVFPRNDRMSVVRQGPMGGIRKIPEDEYTNRGIGTLLTNPSYISVHPSRHYDARQVLDVLKRRGDRTIGLVGTSAMSHQFCEYLKNGALNGAKFVDATDMVDQIKAIKSEEEIACIRKTAAMQDEVMAEVARNIKPGMKDFEVAALAQYAGQMRGSEQGIFLGCSAPQGQPAMFTQRHFQGRELKPGDYLPLLVENNGPGGLYTEISRTFVLGKACQELVDNFEQAKEAQSHTVNRLQPGTPCKDIYAAHNDFLRGRGLPEEQRLYSHSQGYDMVERPLIRDDESMCIEENMNIVVHPMFVAASHFTVVCDNFLITGKGAPERLHKTPREIIEI